jgi:hypothetical protein
MKVIQTSLLTGNINSMDLPITAERLFAWRNGKELIQDAFPDLTTEQREFLLTGSTPAEWNDIFGPDSK